MLTASTRALWESYVGVGRRRTGCGSSSRRSPGWDIARGTVKLRWRFGSANATGDPVWCTVWRSAVSRLPAPGQPPLSTCGAVPPGVVVEMAQGCDSGRFGSDLLPYRTARESAALAQLT